MDAAGVSQGVEHRGIDTFGNSVSLSGNTLAVGAFSEDSAATVGARSEASAATGVNGNQADNSASYAGAVYVFR